MYVSTLSREDEGASAGAAELPPEVRSLFQREQEIATIVYRDGLTTAKDVEHQLPETLANASVRSMLNRLVRKGILLQCQCGKNRSVIYVPALTEPFARQHALKRFAEDFCDGSLQRLLDEIGDFLARPTSLENLLSNYDRTPPKKVGELADRMREIATIVYQNGIANVRDIQAVLSEPLTTAGIRTLLNRLETRGIVRKRPSGRHREVAYLPAIVTRQVRRLALKRLIDGRFGASPEEALRSALQAMQA